MDLIEKSLKIALNAYSGQRDKAGRTYILHPLRVMSRMDTEEEMAVALLHDVLEDSDYTAEDLLREGIPSIVVDAVQQLTKKSRESYDEFVDRVAENPLARKVKIADIEDNINVLRLERLGDRDLERVVKYHRAWQRLKTPCRPGV
jgi:(p)ppGpp synthase/HD superfamily hydrolase